MCSTTPPPLPSTMNETDRDRAALGSRRLLYARLIAARDEAITDHTPRHDEVRRLDDLVKRCGKRLTASTDACRERQRANERRRRALADTCPAPKSLSRALLARRTLREWCRRLRHDLRTQRRAKRRLAEACDALARAEHLAMALERPVVSNPTSTNTSSNNNNPVTTRSHSCGAAAVVSRNGRRARRILSKLSVERVADGGATDALKAHWLSAAREIDVARACSNYCRRTIGEHDAKRIAVGGSAAKARAEMVWISERRTEIDRFVNACSEELLLLTAAVLELETFIDCTREKIVESEGLLWTVEALNEPRSAEVPTPDVEAMVRMRPRVVGEDDGVVALVNDALVFS